MTALACCWQCVLVCVSGLLQLKFCVGPRTQFCLQEWREASWLVATQFITTHTYAYTKTHSQKHTTLQGHSWIGCFCTKCPSETKRTLLDVTTLSFFYQTMCECHLSMRMCGILTAFFFAMRLCECVFLLWTRILDERLIIMQSFMLTDDEMESQPTLREFYQTFKEDFWEQAGNVRRQRYDDVAKDTDFREALIIFYTSKHTLINLCLRSLSGFHFLWGLFIDCQRLTITSEALTSPTLKSGHTYLKLLLIISPHKHNITCIPSSAHLLCLNLK